MKRTVLIALSILSASTVFAADLNVPTVEYPTIQAAIDDCNDGDTVIVASGTYKGAGNRDIDFGGKAITVRSQDGPHSCVIDCQSLGRGFYFGSGEDGNCVLDGFTIINGVATRGGGIYLVNPSRTTVGITPIIANCVLTNNRATEWAKGGGGVHCERASPTIINCTFTGNRATSRHGGGLFTYGDFCRTVVTNCEFRNNTARESGGGMANKLSHPLVTNCRFIGNRSLGGSRGEGGGMWNWHADPTVVNCTFSLNESISRGGGVGNTSGSHPVFVNCLFTWNWARNGDGGGIWGSGASLSGCVFNRNRCGDNGGAIAGIAVLTNCTLNNNSAGDDTGGLYNVASVTNCILWNNRDSGGVDESAQISGGTPAVKYSCIEGWTGSLGGTGNMGQDPCFVETGSSWGPLSYWNFDEGSGSLAYDSALYTTHNHGTLIGDPEWTGGRINGALDFDGDDAVYIQGSAVWTHGLDIYDRDLTISAWVRIRGAGGTIVSRAQPGSISYELGVSTNSAYIGTVGFGYGSWILPTGDILEPHTWYHLAGVFDRTGDMGYVYVNGVLEAEGSMADDPESNNAATKIGCRYSSGSYPFNGLIDEVCIYKQALSYEIIEQLYQKNAIWGGFDHHLLPDSPCLNAGDPSGDYGGQTDIDGQGRVAGGRVDMGADEFYPETPIIEISATEFDLSCSEGGPSPEPQILSVWNGYSGTLNWQMNEDCDWLDVQPTSGESSVEANDVVISIDANGLHGGRYNCVLTVSDSNAVNTPLYVSINLQVNGPIIAVTPTAFDLVCPLGGPSPEMQMVSIWNDHIGTLTWQVAENCGWIEAWPTHGQSSGEANDVLINVDAEDLDSGRHSCAVVVFDPNGISTHQYVTIDLDVRPPVMKLTPTEVNFVCLLGGPDPEPQALSVWNADIGTLKWQITYDCNWLDVSPFSGQSSGEVNEVILSVDAAGLQGGEYSCVLTVSDPNAADSPQYVVVNLDVEPPLIGIAPTDVNFVSPLSGPNPEPQIISVWNEGVVTLNWQITEDCNWLDVQPTSGQSTGEVNEVVININVSGLEGGEYSCVLTVSDPNAINSPQYVTVNLDVRPPVMVVAPTMFHFDCPLGGANPDPQIVSVWNSDIGLLKWQIHEDCDWLSTSPNSGVSSAEVNEVNEVVVSVDANSLRPGIYRCEFYLSDINAVNSPATVYISLYVDVNSVQAIIVDKPRCDSVWASGSIRKIKWSSYNYEGVVDVLFSQDGGGSWEMIESSIADSGSYLWHLPGEVDSNQCLVSVVPSEPDPNVVCVESGLFTIQHYPSRPGAPPGQMRKWDNFRRTGLSDTFGPELGCVKWMFEADGLVSASVTVGVDDRVAIACEDGKLYTLDADGALLWSYDTNSPLISSPVLGYYSMIYVGGENGKLYAIDGGGKLRWTHTTDGFIYSSGAVSADGQVYVCSEDGKLYALGPDGSELWTFETDSPGVVGNSIFASPAIGADGTVYIGGLRDPNLYALDPNDGSVKWACNFEYRAAPYSSHRESGWPFASPVVAADGTIYQTLLYDPNLYAIKPNEPNAGTIIWSTNLADSESGWFDSGYINRHGDVDGWSEPALGPDGTIYVSLNDPYLRAVEPDGSIKWVTRLGMMDGFTLTVGSDGLIYAAGNDGWLCVVDANGLEVARFQSDNWVIFPVISAGNAVIVSDANRVWAIDGCPDGAFVLHRPEDVDASRAVDFVDFALLAVDWLACNDLYPPCEALMWDGTYFTGDIDRNLYVDFVDVAAIANRWLSAD